MYDDYTQLVYLHQDRLRDAEKRREHNELIRAAEAYAERERAEQQDGFMQRVLRMFSGRNEAKQAVGDAKRATAQ